MRKTLLVLGLAAMVCASFTSKHIQSQYHTTAGVRTTLKDTLFRIEAQPKNGFNFPYYIFIPAGTDFSRKQVLLVEPNNTGVNDTLAFHDAGARIAAEKKSLGHQLSVKLKCPYLVPVFPRPAKDEDIYTHAFDGDAARIKGGELKRLDLQLLSMIQNALPELKKTGLAMHDKVFLNGFSASGTFVNRFTLIHPEIVLATASGGINTIAILPIKAIGKTKLDYPLGIHDFEKVFHKPINLAAYKAVPQFIYMGANDTNDAVLFDDAYSKKERQVIFSVIGKEMFPDRWEKCRSVYKDNAVNATFKLYENIGHGTNGAINTEIAGFFSGVMAQLEK